MELLSDGAESAGRNRLRGVAHVHSTRSFDGKCSYAELREILAGSGLHFACMTEHIEGLGQRDVDGIIEDCLRYSDERFLFVPGIEMDCFTIYLLGVGQAKIDFTSNESIYASLLPSSRLCILSHPIKASFQYPESILNRCHGVEILNAKHDGKFYFRPGSERLLRRVRKSRPGVVPLVGLDFHSPDQLCPIHMRLRNGGPLSPDFVLAELAAGRVDFYDGDHRLDSLTGWNRAYRVSRMQLMDLSHFIHRFLVRFGVRVPGSLRRPLSRFLEGG
jgi:hypothetical protein